jgi:hypothetical protein
MIGPRPEAAWAVADEQPAHIPITINIAKILRFISFLHQRNGGG